MSALETMPNFGDNADEGTNYRIRDFRRNEEPRCDDTAMVLHQGKGGNPS